MKIEYLDRINAKAKVEVKVSAKVAHILEEDKEYQKLVDSIPNLNISYYANLKLTDEERQIAYDFMKQCNKENSNEMMKYQNDIEMYNYFR